LHNHILWHASNTLGVATSGRNWCTWSRHLGTRLLRFLTVGRNLYFPVCKD